MSVLLSPSAFQQSINQTTAAVVLPAPSEPSSTSLGAIEPPTIYSKKQLQETLVHLIKVRQEQNLSTVASIITENVKAEAVKRQIKKLN